MSKCSSWTHMAKRRSTSAIVFVIAGPWHLTHGDTLCFVTDIIRAMLLSSMWNKSLKRFQIFWCFFLTCHFPPVGIWTSHQPSGSSGRNLKSGQNSEQWKTSFFHQWLLRLQFPTQVDHINSLMPHDDLSNGPTSQYQSSIQSYERENSPRRPFMVDGWGWYNMWPLPW